MEILTVLAINGYLSIISSKSASPLKHCVYASKHSMRRIHKGYALMKYLKQFHCFKKYGNQMMIVKDYILHYCLLVGQIIERDKNVCHDYYTYAYLYTWILGAGPIKVSMKRRLQFSLYYCIILLPGDHTTRMY